MLEAYAEAARDYRKNLDPLLLDAAAAVEGWARRWNIPTQKAP